MLSKSSLGILVSGHSGWDAFLESCKVRDLESASLFMKSVCSQYKPPERTYIAFYLVGRYWEGSSTNKFFPGESPGVQN